MRWSGRIGGLFGFDCIKTLAGWPVVILSSNETLSFELRRLRVPAGFHAVPAHKNATRFVP